LQQQDVREITTVELTDLSVVESRQARTSRGERTPPSVEIEVSAPTEGWSRCC
jgi:hypothetical protein